MKILEDEGYYDKIHPLNMQILWPALSFVVMRWLKENEPKSYNKAKYFLNAHDYIRFKLTGVLGAEITDISGTGLLNTKEQRIDREMLKLGGIEEVADMIPPLVGSFDEAGKITKEVAEFTGLGEGFRFLQVVMISMPPPLQPVPLMKPEFVLLQAPGPIINTLEKPRLLRRIFSPLRYFHARGTG